MEKESTLRNIQPITQQKAIQSPFFLASPWPCFAILYVVMFQSLREPSSLRLLRLLVLLLPPALALLLASVRGLRAIGGVSVVGVFSMAQTLQFEFGALQTGLETGSTIPGCLMEGSGLA